MTERVLAPFDATPSTLAAVLAAAPDGAEIRLAPGRYAGPLRLDRSIDLIGPADGRHTVTITSSTSPVVTMAEIGASLCRVRVQLEGLPDHPDRWAVAVAKTGTLVEVDVDAPGGSAVVVDPGSAVLIDDLNILGAARFGLAFFAGARGRATNVRASACGMAGLLVRDKASPELSGVDISGPGLAAAAFHAGASGIISDLTTHDCAIGLRLGRDARPVIRGAHLYGGVSALVFAPGARGDLMDVACEGQSRGSVRLGADADPRIERLSVDGQSYAVFAQDRAAGVILDSDLRSPAATSVVYAGPGVTTDFIRGRWRGGYNGLFAMGARAGLQRIAMSDQAGSGINARAGALVSALGVTCTNPGIVGLSASGGATIRASLSAVHGAKFSGALAFDAGSRLELASTDFFDSGRAGLELGAGASALVQGGTVARAHSIGLLAKQGARLEVANVHVSDTPLGLAALFGSEVLESGLSFEGCTRDRAYESLLDAASRVVEDVIESGELPPEDESDQEAD